MVVPTASPPARAGGPSQRDVLCTAGSSTRRMSTGVNPSAAAPRWGAASAFVNPHPERPAKGSLLARLVHGVDHELDMGDGGVGEDAVAEVEDVAGAAARLA